MADVAIAEPITLPKELLAFIEHKVERAIEVLREIVMEPEYTNAPQQAIQPAWPQAVPGDLSVIGGMGTGIGQAQTVWPNTIIWSSQATTNVANLQGTAIGVPMAIGG